MADTASQLEHTGPAAAGSDVNAGSPVFGSGDLITKQANLAVARQRSTDAPLACVYVVQTRFAKAVKQVRSSLKAAGLAIISETDISASIRASLGMELAPCSILSVTCPFLLLQAFVMEPALLTLIPVHVVAIEKDHLTRIYVLNPSGLGSDGAGALNPRLRELSRRIRQCLDHVAARIPGAW
jgi:uncharacterized protein (DUF302 family)